MEVLIATGSFASSSKETGSGIVIPVAIVTGATSGIGREIARELVGKGFHVCAIGRRNATARLQEAFAAGASGEREFDVAVGVCHMRADLADHESVAALSEVLFRRYPGVDLLVHAAGTYDTDEHLLASPHNADALFRTNVSAPLRLTLSLREALGRARGTVVIIGSTGAENPFEDSALYGGSKAAVAAAAKSLRSKLNPQGIRVALITLGRTDTPMQALVQDREGRELEMESLIRPASVARLVSFLSDLPPDIELTEIVARPKRAPVERAPRAGQT